MQVGNRAGQREGILILGGSGFVGPALVSRLLEIAPEVTVLNRGTRFVPGTRCLIADRNSDEQLGQAARAAGAQYSAVVDLSCYDDRQAELAWRYFSNRTRLWVHLSSAAIYADASSRPPQENDPTGGAPAWGSYGAEKSRAEDFLRIAAMVEGAPEVVSLRPPYLYGPGNNLDRETFIWRRALAKRPVFIPGVGSTPIQFLHVDDLATVIALIIERHGEGCGFRAYNVAGDPVLTQVGWVDLLCQILNTPNVGILAGDAGAQFSARQYFPFRDYPCWVNTNAIRDQLGWHPQYSAIEGFRQTFASLAHGRDWRHAALVELNDVERAISRALRVQAA